MSSDPKGTKVQSHTNGTTVRWAIGILASIALLGAALANGAVWNLVSDVKSNAVAAATNRTSIEGIKELLYRIERKVERIDDKLDGSKP